MIEEQEMRESQQSRERARVAGYRSLGMNTDRGYTDDVSVIADPLKGFKSISWSAVFAGVVVAMVLQVVMGLLGIGIGAANVNPMYEADPMSGLGISASVWFAVSGLIALFGGGWVAGRLAGIPRAVDSALHGFIAWGLATLVVVYLLGTTLGTLTGGAFRILGGSIAAVTSSVGAAASAAGPSVLDSAKSQLNKNGISMDLSDLQNEATTLLQQTGKPELNPDNLKGQSVTDIVTRFSNSPEATLNAVDRQAVTNVIMARTGKSQEEADQVVASLQQKYQDARAKYEQAKVQAEQKAREIGQKSAEGIARGALWSVLAILLGAVAASSGGYLATRRYVAIETDSTTLKH